MFNMSDPALRNTRFCDCDICVNSILSILKNKNFKNYRFGNRLCGANFTQLQIAGILADGFAELQLKADNISGSLENAKKNKKLSVAKTQITKDKIIGWNYGLLIGAI